MLLMLWLLHLISKRILWTMLTSLNTKFLIRFWKRNYTTRCSVLGEMEAVSRSRQFLGRGNWTDAAISCCRCRIWKQIGCARSPEVGCQKVLPWWRNLWFPIPSAPTALKHSGGWSTLALYFCATRVRGALLLQANDFQPRKSAAWGPEHLEEKQFAYPKHISQMITGVCTVQLRTFSASDTTSDATLSTSELRQLYPDTVLWGEKCYALHWYHLLYLTSATHYTQIILRSILFYVYIATSLQSGFRCKTSTQFTSPLNHSRIPFSHLPKPLVQFSMNNNEVNEYEFYQHLDFGHECEKCSLSPLHPQESTILSSSIPSSKVTLTTWLRSLHWLPQYGFPLKSWATHIWIECCKEELDMRAES